MSSVTLTNHWVQHWKEFEIGFETLNEFWTFFTAGLSAERATEQLSYLSYFPQLLKQIAALPCDIQKVNLVNFWFRCWFCLLFTAALFAKFLIAVDCWDDTSMMKLMSMSPISEGWILCASSAGASSFCNITNTGRNTLSLHFGSRLGFWGTAYLTASFKFTSDDPCCHGNEIWDKICYDSAYIRHIPDIFVYNRGFSGSGYWMTPAKFYRDQPPLPRQRNLVQNQL